MPKSVTIRAHSTEAHKRAGGSPDISATVNFPTLAEAMKIPALAAMFERSAHRNIAIDVQAKLRANHNKKTGEKLAPQAIVDGINWETLGNRQRAGLSAKKLGEVYFILANSGRLAVAGELGKMQAAGNMVEAEKLARKECPEVFAKAPAKAKVAEPAAPVKK